MGAVRGRVSDYELIEASMSQSSYRFHLALCQLTMTHYLFMPRLLRT